MLPLKNIKGFTLVELMITIAIAAILLAIAVPSFRTLFESGEVDAELIELKSTIALLRSESIKTGKRTALCASSDGATCGDDATWKDGYIGFVCDNASAANNDCTTPSTPDDDIFVIKDGLQNIGAFAYKGIIVSTHPTSGEVSVTKTATKVITLKANGNLEAKAMFALCAVNENNDNAKLLSILPSGQAFSDVLGIEYHICGRTNS